jgi:hypothetical protein
MANFRLRKDAEKWFGEISNAPEIKVKWDIYYMCLMAGFASGRSSEAAATDMVERFVEEYRPVRHFLIGLLVVAELRLTKVDLTNRMQVRELFRKLIQPNGTNDLTDFGMRRMNAYASGGWEYLSENRDQRPYSIEEFMQSFPKLIERATADALIQPI